MGALVVGLSFRTTPMDLLERAVLDPAACHDLAAQLCRSEHVSEAVALSTCNRLEIYAVTSRFHGGLAAAGDALAGATGIDLDQLTDHLYVHYEEAAVAHLFTLTAGLDSMAVGEQQILGQVRSAMRQAQQTGTASRALVSLLQQALRVGKRAHAETDLDRAGVSLVEVALEEARRVTGPLPAASALVVGAGAMSGLAAATLQRAGVGRLTVINRTRVRAERLAASAGGDVVDLAELAPALAEADLVLSCTGAVGHLIDAAAARTALAERGGRPQAYLDLAMPRDIDPLVADLDGVTLVDLDALGRRLAGGADGGIVGEARDLVLAEVRAFLDAQSAQEVAPTVVALRGLARSVVEGELDRLRSRLGAGTDARTVAELEQTVHRVVEKLLHTPTVRVKELAAEPNGSAYAQALRELFDLDLNRVEAVTAMSEPETAAPNGAGR